MLAGSDCEKTDGPVQKSLDGLASIEWRGAEGLLSTVLYLLASRGHFGGVAGLWLAAGMLPAAPYRAQDMPLPDRAVIVCIEQQQRDRSSLRWDSDGKVISQ